MSEPLFADPFIPGLKPRGHEDLLYATPRELLAALPRSRALPGGAYSLHDDDPFETTDCDQELARHYLRRHGHRSDS